jgi:glucose/arabinose dehydrogenase
MTNRTPLLAATLVAMHTAFSGAASAQAFTIEGTKGTRLNAQEVASFKEPWSMTFLPDGTMLVNTKPGKMFHVKQDGTKTGLRRSRGCLCRAGRPGRRGASSRLCEQWHGLYLLCRGR